MALAMQGDCLEGVSHMLLNNLLTFVAGKFGVPRPCRDAADFAVGGAWKSCYGGDAFG